MGLAMQLPILTSFLCFWTVAKGLPQLETESSSYHFEKYSGENKWNTNWASLTGRINRPKCLEIPAKLTLCRGIGYQEMRIPNLLEHDSMSEVTQQASPWVPLLGIDCHPDTQLFLCSLFAPVCRGLERVIWPCRSLCQAVQGGCEGSMQRWGYPWPEMLRCDKFPLDNGMCIGPQNHTSQDDTVCQACRLPDTYESIIDNYCRAEFVLKLKVRKLKTKNGLLKLSFKKKKKFYKKGNLRKKHLKKMVAYISSGSLRCDCPRGQPAGKTYHLLMGVKQGEKFMVTFITQWQRRNKNLRRAIRAIKKKNVCKAGMITDTGDDVNTSAQSGKGEGRKRKSRKGKGRKGRRKKRPKTTQPSVVSS